MHHISLVKEAQTLIAESLSEGGIAIDATVGNGFDTVFLARQVGNSGMVYGFDLQPAALQATRTRLQQLSLLARVKLIHADHATLPAFIDHQQHGPINAVMFNLGYLPGSDKKLITRSKTTLAALNSAAELLDIGGMITIIAYPGHPGGEQEKNAVINWCEQLNTSKYKIDTISPASTNPKTPHLFAVKRC